MVMVMVTNIMSMMMAVVPMVVMMMSVRPSKKWIEGCNRDPFTMEADVADPTRDTTKTPSVFYQTPAEAASCKLAWVSEE